MSQDSTPTEQFKLIENRDMEPEKMPEWEYIWEEIAGTYAEGVSLPRLQEMIQRTSIGHRIPDEVISKVLLAADKNMDGYLQKDEFMDIISKTKRSPWMRRALREVVWLAVPASERNLKTRLYYDYYTCCPPPLFVPLISLLQVAAFIYYAVDMGLPMAPMSPCPTYSPLVYDPARRYEVWRYFTYMAIHSGWMHLLGNLLVQLVFGVILEMVHGSWRISLIYLSGVLFGALATSVTAPGFFLAGASGGVYAVQYAHLGNLLINWGEMKYPALQAAVIGLVSLIDMSYAIYDTFYVQTPSHTGHLAHVGGALCGVLLGICVLRNLKKLDWERYCLWAALTLLLLLLLVMVVVNAAAPGYYPPTDHTSMSALRDKWMMANHNMYSYYGS